MLVLSRKLQEKIQIGDHIVITVLQVKGRQVRLGIQAPRSVRVLRSELPQETTLETSDDTTEAAGTEQDMPATDVHGTDEAPGVSRFTAMAGKPLVLGRRFRIISPAGGAHRQAVAAVAIG